MSGVVVVNQPGFYLVDADGNVVTLADGDTIGNAESLIIAGKDGTVARMMAVDSSGKLAIQNPPNLDAALSTLATEAKLEAVRALLATIDADTSNLDVALSTRASEATLSTLATESKLEAVRVLLASIDGKDFATETTLAALRTDFNAEDFASETTLAAAKAVLDTIDAVLDTIYARQADKTQFSRITDGTNDAVVDASGDLQVIHTDALPAGTNMLGQVQLRNPADNANMGDQTTPVRNNPSGNDEITGAISALNGVVEADVAGCALVGVQITGTWVGTLVGEYSIDGTEWNSLEGYAIEGSAAVSETTQNGNFVALVSGFKKMRVRASVYTSGTANIVITTTVTTGRVIAHSRGVDIDGNVRDIAVSSQGAINVTVVGSVPPEGVDGVSIYADSPLSVGTHDTSYVIPTGETFVLQQFTAGNEDPTKGAKVTILYDDGTEHVIQRGYIAGFTVDFPLPNIDVARDGTPLLGTGTSTIVIRREKLTAANIEIDAVVRGYSQ